jgi:hypothetical protein
MNKWVLKERNTKSSYLANSSVVQILKNCDDMNLVRKFETEQQAELCAKKIHTYSLMPVQMEENEQN